MFCIQRIPNLEDSNQTYPVNFGMLLQTGFDDQNSCCKTGFQNLHLHLPNFQSRVKYIFILNLYTYKVNSYSLNLIKTFLMILKLNYKMGCLLIIIS